MSAKKKEWEPCRLAKTLSNTDRNIFLWCYKRELAMGFGYVEEIEMQPL
jgi:hypothetical protein